jgi:hypothetical protein
VLTAIEMFTGNAVTADMVLEFINNPTNAINLEANAHEAMNKRLAWGIEARLVNNEVRVMRLCGVADPDIIQNSGSTISALSSQPYQSLLRISSMMGTK